MMMIEPESDSANLGSKFQVNCGRFEPMNLAVALSLHVKPSRHLGRESHLVLEDNICMASNSETLTR